MLEGVLSEPESATLGDPDKRLGRSGVLEGPDRDGEDVPAFPRPSLLRESPSQDYQCLRGGARSCCIDDRERSAPQHRRLGGKADSVEDEGCDADGEVGGREGL